MFTTVLIFIVILGILVFVHEFGHFIVAKKSGMVVHEFGFGFPPRLVGIQKIDGRWKFVWGHKTPGDISKTVYSINWIPLGGFVKIMGENNEDENHPHSFVNKAFWPRFFTLVAGVVMNFILAWVIYSAGFAVGLPAAFDSQVQVPKQAIFFDAKLGVVEVVKGLPADKAGMREGDVIVSVDGQTFTGSEAVRNYITANAGKTFAVNLRRGSENLSLNIQSQKNPPEGQGPTGIALATLGKIRYPWYLAIWEGLKEVGLVIAGIFAGLYVLVTSHLGLSALGGPVQIARLTGQVANLGFIYLMQFTAFLSINLGVLNILPFPALDGGRVLFLLIEKIRGKKNNQKIEQWANTAGFVFLLLLMLLVTINDVRKGF